jgi:hypothetical protein
VICDRIGCTGVHNLGQPWTTVCEATKERQRERQRRLRITPGTYRYKESHGLGRPGLVGYIAERVRDLLAQREKLQGELNG